jgi:hypothetical protein
VDSTQPRPQNAKRQPCKQSDCTRSAVTRGLCRRHYLRWWRATPSNQRPTPTRQQRFWAKVDKGPGCWEWTGSRRPSGHGQFVGDHRKAISASTYSLMLHLGYPPPEGTETCHRCDNPPCVNPRHLYYGTRQNNIDDAWARGRMPVGSERYAAKLNEEQVVLIREAYALGADASALAEQFGIAVVTLRHIVLGLKWKQVGGPITRRRPKRARKAA